MRHNNDLFVNMLLKTPLLKQVVHSMLEHLITTLGKYMGVS